MRTYVVTGAASGIGKACASLIRAAGDAVIGVDVHDADVIADLSTPEGRSEMAAAFGERVDAVIACAGVLAADPLTVRVNYFGAVRTAELLRPLLDNGSHPGVVVVSSMAGIHDARADIVDACLDDDEDGAIAAAARAVDAGAGDRVYASSKQALSRWVRRTAPTESWAGAGITLNAVAPGVVRTPMTAALLASERQREWIDRDVPMLLGGYAEPEQLAEVLVWLASEHNTIVTGQILYADGGADASVRGDTTW